ncbi:MAG: HAD family hydrolase [Planctomycetota bacterium]|nr:HAD family hydrolase [Planctomycetota bacterium]
MIRAMHIADERIENPRPAVFLDRDGTLTEYCGFVTQPEQLLLLDGVLDSINSLRAAGFACVVVTNQSAVGRRLITEDQLDRIHHRLITLLSRDRCLIEAIYDCPEKPEGQQETQVTSSDRKPGPGMLLQAAADLNLDLSQSWMVGDRVSDVLAGINAGCRGSIRVESGYCYENGPPEIAADYVTEPSLSEAVEVILRFSEAQGVQHARRETLTG